MSDNLPVDTNTSSEISDASANSGDRLNKIMLVGAPEWIRGMIYRLHSLGFTEAGSWSRLMPTQNQDEMISILARRRTGE